MAEDAPASLRLDWPPPGLERVHGQVWPIIGGLGIGGAIMVSPLLWATATDQPFWNVASNNSSLWSTLAFMLVDFLVLIEAYLHLGAVLRESVLAARLGFGWRLIALVAGDHSGNSGQLLTRTGEFAGLTDQAHADVVRGRTFGSIAYLAGVAWLPLAFPVALLLASLGAITDTTVWMITLLPATMLLVLGLILRAIEQWQLRKSARPPRDEQRLRGQMALWRFVYAQLVSRYRDGAATPRVFQGLRVLVLVGMVLLFIPLLHVISATGTGVAIDRGVFLQYEAVQRKLASVEALRGYAPAPDSSITPQQAAASVYALIMAGNEAYDLFRAPVRSHPGWPQGMTDSLKSVPGSFAPLTPGLRNYITKLARHPALAEFNVAGHARSADMLGALYALPLPDTLSMMNLPIPRYFRMREAVHAQLARSALLLEQGETDAAEQGIRQVIGLGLLVIDNGRTLIETLMGANIAEWGGNALEALYLVTNRPADASLLRSARTAAERASAIGHAGSGSPTPGRVLEEVPKVVLKEELAPGFRWELFSSFNTFVPCLNLHNVLFGLGTDYEHWLSQVRASLVRYPGDAQLFDMARHGVMGTRLKPAPICGPAGAWMLLHI